MFDSIGEEFFPLLCPVISLRKISIICHNFKTELSCLGDTISVKSSNFSTEILRLRQLFYQVVESAKVVVRVRNTRQRAIVDGCWHKSGHNFVNCFCSQVFTVQCPLSMFADGYLKSRSISIAYCGLLNRFSLTLI